MNKEQLIKNLKLDSFPTNYYSKKQSYDEAETAYYENLAKAKVALTPLAGEVAKARQRLIESRDNFTSTIPSVDAGAIKFIEKKVVEFEKVIDVLLNRVASLENALAEIKLGNETKPKVVPRPQAALPVKKEEDDDVDLFGSDSDDENEAAAKIREDRLAAYAAKKSKKPVLIAKSNVILDIKPWDDETDLKAMEEFVRKIETEGLLWGASKLVPLAYTIKKLQISCVVEDEKVSIDWLTEQIEALEDFVQSVDIAAFNKI